MEIILMSESDYVREWRRLMKNEGWTYFFSEACPVLQRPLRYGFSSIFIHFLSSFANTSIFYSIGK